MEKTSFLVFVASVMILFVFLNCRARKITVSSAGKGNHSFMIIGHRGAAGLAPENTITAIETGLAFKCDRIEIDVHQTKDSVLVMMHDETINRTTDGRGAIRNLTLSQLRNFHIKSSNMADSGRIAIPTLEEALQTIGGKCVLLIELKEGGDYYPGIEKRVLDLIRKYKAESWCMIHSFKEKILKDVHQLAPEIPLHRLMLNGIFGGSATAGYITEVSVFSRTLTKPFIDKMHQAGKKVNVWTTNNMDDMKYFIHLGVDGIITDFPDIAQQVKETFHQN
jgi:glycerophosphoryl diester phosphodiesterase